MKKLITAAVFSVALATGCYPDHYPIRVVPGTGSTYSMSLERAERNFHHLARTAEKEDMWLRVGHRFHDIGSGEKGYSVHTNIKRIMNLVKEKYPRVDEVTLIHTQPVIDHWLCHTRWNSDQSLDDAPPSSKDIYYHGIYQKALREGLSVNLVSEVYDGIGVWKFYVTMSLEERLALIQSTPYGANGIEFLPFYMEMSERNKILQNKSLSKKERIEQYIQGVKQVGVLLEYRAIN